MKRKRYSTRLNIHIDHSYFSLENLHKYPHRMVLVGFIAADGCIRKLKNGQTILVFNISVNDKNALEIINNEICKGCRNLSYLKKTNSVMLTIPSDEICTDLERYNIVPRKSKIFEMPPLSRNELKYFLRGYVYGDGCITTKSCVIVGSFAFASAMQELFPECRVYKTQSPNCKQIHFTGTRAMRFTKFIFGDNFLMLIPRKHIIIHAQLQNSKWTSEEIKLLSNMSPKEFSILTGRSIATAYKYKRIIIANIQNTF